jgi:IMP cyclohydrolase
MYVGRIAIVGRSQKRSFVAYRVSSRSFPSRRAEVRGKSILVSPLDLADLARNPYIAYDCIRVAGDLAVVANGTHADMIAERIEDGQKPLDAIALSLVAYGYERDELDTPRIAGAVRGERAWLGIAKRDEYRFGEFKLEDGLALFVATYEKTGGEAVEIGGSSAEEIARRAYDLPFSRPVCAAAALALPKEEGSRYDLAVYNPM